MELYKKSKEEIAAEITSKISEFNNRIIKEGKKLFYILGTDTPPKPMFGGCFYNRDFDQIYIKEVIYANPTVIVFWNDGTKTTAKCQGSDVFDSEKGLLLCVAKKLVDGSFVAKTLEDWGQPVPGRNRVTLTDVRAKHRKNS